MDQHFRKNVSRGERNTEIAFCYFIVLAAALPLTIRFVTIRNVIHILYKWVCWSISLRIARFFVCYVIILAVAFSLMQRFEQRATNNICGGMAGRRDFRLGALCGVQALVLFENVVEVLFYEVVPVFTRATLSRHVCYAYFW